MILKSINTSGFLINYPKLKLLILNVVYPVFYFGLFLLLLFIQIVLIVLEHYNAGIVFPFLIALLIYLISFRVRKGQVSKQILQLENDQLSVINYLFPFRFKKKYLISSLDIESTKLWNILTGGSINTTSNYARLIINNDKKLYHFYNEKELKELIDEFKSGANKV